MNEEEITLEEKEYPQSDLLETAETIKQVEEIKEAVDSTVTESSLPDKVVDLRDMLENLSGEVNSWKTWHKKDYLGAVETLKNQVEEIHSEWGNVSNSLMAQREKLESLLQTVPGIIETATLKALFLRVTHLEKLVSQMFGESQTKAALKGSRKQLIISIVALSVTVVFWAVFTIINIIK